MFVSRLLAIYHISLYKPQPQAKDCIRLLYLWLTKRELESRKVKNRTFAGVDIKELDLIKSPRRDNQVAEIPAPAETKQPNDAPAPANA